MLTAHMNESPLDLNFYNQICDTPIVAEPRAPYGPQQKGFRDLRVWQAGMDLAESCYRASQSFPASEQFGLTSQLRLAAISVPANLAEGWGRNTQREFARFVDISHGSLCEVESLIEVSNRLKLIQAKTMAKIVEETNKVGAMQFRLQSKLRQ
jgi:four helix bundle protein